MIRLPDPEPARTRVILSEAHDDVIRTGYDLGLYIMHQEPGPGLDLLLRRFANDRQGKEGGDGAAIEAEGVPADREPTQAAC